MHSRKEIGELLNPVVRLASSNRRDLHLFLVADDAETRTYDVECHLERQSKAP